MDDAEQMLNRDKLHILILQDALHLEGAREITYISDMEKKTQGFMIYLKIIKLHIPIFY
jgi:hypothetical protein